MCVVIYNLSFIDHGGVPADGRAPGGRQAEGHQYPLHFRGSWERGIYVLQLQTGAQVHNATQNIQCQFVRASVCKISVLCCFPTYSLNNICSYTDNVMIFIFCKQQNIEYTFLNTSTHLQHLHYTPQKGNIYVYAVGRRFYPRELALYLRSTFGSVHAFL